MWREKQHSSESYTYIHVRTHTHIHIYAHTHTKCTYETHASTPGTTTAAANVQGAVAVQGSFALLFRLTQSNHFSHIQCKDFIEIPAKKWGDTGIAERGRSVLVMRARYRSAGLTPHQRGWTDAG